MNNLENKENKKRCNIIDCVMAVLVVATVIAFILILYVISIFTHNWYFLITLVIIFSDPQAFYKSLHRMFIWNPSDIIVEEK